MLPVSDRFLLALRESHSITVRATLFRPGSTDPRPVRVVGGSVDMNAAARVMRQGTLDVAVSREDVELIALLAEMPYGGYVTIERGIRYADLTVELVPLGHFRVESVVTAELSGVATLTLADRFAQVQDEPFPLPFSVTGMHPSDAIVEIVRQVFGEAIQYHVLTDPASEGVMGDVVYDDARTEAISDLTQAIEAECLFDAYGDFVLRPSYKDDALPVWTIDAGDEGVMIGGQAQVDRSSVRNGVTVKGQPDSDIPPVYGLATYSAPGSPIRWGGPFGRVVMLAESQTVTTELQAVAVARSLLNLRLSMTRTLSLEAVPCPALEPEDVITVVFADGHSEEQAVKEVHIGLEADAVLGVVSVDKYAPDFAPTSLPTFAGEDALRELMGAQVVAA